MTNLNNGLPTYETILNRDFTTPKGAKSCVTLTDNGVCAMVGGREINRFMHTPRIYVDNAATSPMPEAVLQAMMPYLGVSFGNPSSTHSYGQEAQQALETARKRIAQAIGAYNNEIYFTSGGTEADNWIVHSVSKQQAKKGKHLISTKIEHNAMLRPLENLQADGFEITLLEPDRFGMITPEQLTQAIREDTLLVSIMSANNVVGTVLPIQALCAAAHKRNVLFHTDAVQAVGHIRLDVHALGVDFLSISAHKFHGPKGVGALFSKLGLPVTPLIAGGGQEKGRRSGTENVASLVGMAAALEASVTDLDAHLQSIARLRDKLIAGILKIPGAHLTGDPVHRLPGLASFLFEQVPGQLLIPELDKIGICASSGAACSAASKDASHVLLAMGYPPALAHGALRLSLSRYNTEAEIDVILEALPNIVRSVRQKQSV
ncbi:MAG: cysteine desulfurase [Treponema sp.]|nr:cysteine desulfurase [Treponema sp.]